MNRIIAGGAGYAGCSRGFLACPIHRLPSAIALIVMGASPVVDAECQPDARLAICGRTDVQGTVDGAWWPPDYDLRTGLPDLVSVMGRWLGPVRRVLYDASVFPSAPARVIRGGAAISVDRYAMVSPDTLYLVGSHSRTALLWVVPPQTPAADARTLLATVAEAAMPMTVRRLRAIVGGDPLNCEEMG